MKVACILLILSQSVTSTARCFFVERLLMLTLMFVILRWLYCLSFNIGSSISIQSTMCAMCPEETSCPERCLQFKHLLWNATAMPSELSFFPIPPFGGTLSCQLCPLSSHPPPVPVAMPSSASLGSIGKSSTARLLKQCQGLQHNHTISTNGNEKCLQRAPILKRQKKRAQKRPPDEREQVISELVREVRHARKQCGSDEDAQRARARQARAESLLRKLRDQEHQHDERNATQKQRKRVSFDM